MKFYLEFIFILFYLKKCLNLEIDNFLTPPYQEMNFKDNDIGNVIFYFTQEVNKSDFTEIYLTNSTHKLTLFNAYNDPKYCLFRKKMVKCIYPKNEGENETMGEKDNLDYKFYYSLKYTLTTSPSDIKKGLVTVAINSGNFIKYLSIFFLILIF
jgi:hypothetical protein